jgi:division protein 1
MPGQVPGSLLPNPLQSQRRSEGIRSRSSWTSDLSRPYECRYCGLSESEADHQLFVILPISRVPVAVAPLIMTPKFISAAAASSSRNHNPYITSSSSSSSSKGLSSQLAKVAFPSFPRRSTSTSLGILEAAPLLLNQPIPDVPQSSEGGGSVSFLRGFQATVPSSEKGKERRRKVRGGVADVGFVNAKKFLTGGKERGLLTEDGEAHEEGETGGRGGQVGMTGKERRRRKREKAEREGGKGGANLSKEELMRMQEEIGWDRENLVVRKVGFRYRCRTYRVDPSC